MLVFKNIFRRKVRTLLSVMGIAIGIGAIIAFNAIASGFKESLNQYMRESGAQLVLFARDAQDLSVSRIAESEIREMAAMPGVVEISRATFYIASPRGLQVTGAMPALFLFGRDPSERLIRKYKNEKLQGRLLAAEDEIMLGSMAASKLGKKAGDTLALFDRTFTIAGVYFSPIYWENVGGVAHLKVLQEKLGTLDSISVGFVYLEDPRRAEEFRVTIEERWKKVSAVHSDQFTGAFDQLQYIDWFVWVVSLVSVAVGGLGVLNTMLMSVSERTREIGTLRAVGWSRGLVLRLVLSEGTLISALGGLLGLGVGMAGAEVLIRWAPSGFLATLYWPMLFVQAFAVAVVLGFVGTLYPAWQASRLSPIEALKYE